MFIEIHLENFQQSEDVHLHFSEGLTLIKGSNNQGKSSLIRAINAVVFNNPRRTKGYIMNGKKFCSVTIEVEGYKRIFWKKTKKEVLYIIGNDKPIEKAGRLCLKDVYPDHPFTLFENNLLFNVIQQKSRPVLFNINTSQVFNLFEELYGILSTKDDISKFSHQSTLYNTQLNEVLQNSRELKAKHKLLTELYTSKDTNKVKIILNKLKHIESFFNALDKVKSLKAKCLQYKIIQQPITINEFQSLNKELKYIEKIVNIKNELDSYSNLKPPIENKFILEYIRIQKINSVIQDINHLKDQVNYKNKEIQEIKKLLPVCPTCKRPFN